MSKCLLWGLVVALVAAAAAAAGGAPSPSPSAPCPPCGRCHCCEVPAGWPPTLGREPFSQPAVILNCTRGTGRTLLNGEKYPDTSSYGKARVPGRLVWATFRLNELTKVYQLEMEGVRLLDLSDNKIRSVHATAFSKLRQLQRLSLARNALYSLSKKMFSDVGSLEFIDLAQNALTSFDVDSLTSLERLHFLNLSGNAIGAMNPGALFAFAPNLQVLDLSHNKLSTLEEGIFEGLSGLSELYLAGNSLQALDLDVLAPLDALQVLDVSGNAVDRLLGSGPASLRELRAGGNRLSQLQPLLAALPSLSRLRLPDNAVASLEGAQLGKLEELEISGNPLSSLPADLSAPSLRRLEVSRCNFESVPPQLTGAHLPNLEVLILDGNKLLQSVVFPKNASFPRLRYLSLSSLPYLKEVTARAFDGLLKAASGDIKKNSTEGDNCTMGTLQLRLSQNNMLSTIHPNSLLGLPLCTLDLSGNALETLDNTTVKWTSLEWINLQHNPWYCQCSLQWMVDVVVTHLYPTAYADLLYELRCSTPAALRGRRLVHFFNQSKPALCEEPFSHMKAASDSDVELSVTMGGSSVALGVILGLCVLLIILIVIGVAFTWRRRSLARRRNRRF